MSSSEAPILQQAEIEKRGQEIIQESPEVQIAEISNEQFHEYANVAEQQVEQSSAEIISEGQQKIDVSTKSMGISPEMEQSVREEQGLDVKLSEVQAEADQLANEAKGEIEAIKGKPELAEGLDKDPRMEAIKTELVEGWKRSTGGDILSAEGQNFMFGNLATEKQYRTSVKKRTEEVFAERFPEDAKAYAEKEKTRVYESPDEDPVIKEVEKNIIRITNQDVTRTQEGNWGESAAKEASGAGYGGTWDKNFSRVSMQQWNNFVSEHPEKAVAYRDKNESINRVFEGQERLQRSRESEERGVERRRALEENWKHEREKSQQFRKDLLKIYGPEDETAKESVYTPEQVASIENEPETIKSSSEGLKNQDLTPEGLIEFRFNQSRDSRLCEYLTGLRPEDPKILERLKEDFLIIRAKYGLPDRQLRFEAPGEYERLLREKAKEIGVMIKSKSECGSFFDDYPGAGGVFFENNNSIGVTINKDNKDEFIKNLGVLEHEYIHARQHKEAPRMPVELMEYEAYVAGISLKYFSENIENIKSIFFNFFIGGSVNNWYREKNDNRDEKDPVFTPQWDDPVYFLQHVDKIDQALIDIYKQK